MNRRSSFFLAGLIPLVISSGSFETAASGPKDPLSARRVIERIRERVGVEWRKETVDTFKAGNPDATVKGIVTTMFPTYTVLKAAAASGKNLVICHEPAFYDHFDQAADLVKAGDRVLADKKAFIEKNGLIIWRFHDHWHLRKPDGIQRGMVRALGWEKFQDPAGEEIFRIPETSLLNLCREMKRRLGCEALRAVGNPDMVLTKVAFLPGAPESVEQMGTLGRSDIDAVVSGETREWETMEYARDAAAEGKPKALIILGHVASEQAGMEECARWLRTFISEVPVEFMPSGEPFWVLK